MAKAKSSEDALVEQAFSADKDAKVVDAIKNLTPEEAEFFLFKLEAAIRKRKVQISGYLAAMLIWAVGTFLALIYYSTHDDSRGWIFLAPFAAVGVVLWGFGKWAEKIGQLTPPIAIPSKDANPT